MEQRVLTPLQERAIALVAKEPVLGKFYLTGGTALAAFYLHHRYSDDLGFFVADVPSVVSLEACMEQVKDALGAAALRFYRIHDRNQFFFTLDGEELKIEFTRYPFASLETPQEKNGIRVDSLRDIAANKMMAILDRFEPKDFVDLFFLLQDRTLEEVRRDAVQKFGLKIDPLFLGGELMKARRIEALPNMIKPLTVSDLKAFFAARARELAPEVLSS